ncbi:hypothetical protein COJ92_06300 [Priestia megaterium]|uniref:hypothetical protein n=1 Tax=Priestia megaterium TaxID=1404 RepID=UPI000BF75843|nr:hypothetical protein [Priestia megaterium]PFP20177.1 hypothetical protein COJ92_06300 [Priestia megaterium]
MKRYMLSAFLGSLLLLLTIAFSSTFHIAIVKTTGSIGGIILAAAALVMNALEDPPSSDNTGGGAVWATYLLLLSLPNLIACITSYVLWTR